MDKLDKYVNELDTAIDKIKNSEKTEINEMMILPLSDLINDSEFIEKKSDNNSAQIKELKYFQFNDFSRISDKIDSYLSSLTDETINLLPQEADVQSIEFVLYEILINIYKHSRFRKAYLQIITSELNTEICIYDDGIGIPQSFKEASMESDNDCEAIYEAVNGKTTDKEKYSLHGRGLNSAARIVTLGFDGEMLIISENGSCLIKKEGAETKSNRNTVKGTLIVISIWNKKVDNIYEYLRFKSINKIKEDDYVNARN